MEKPVRLLRLPAVLARVGFSKSRLYALAAEGKFPTPVQIGERATAWVESEIDEWIAARVASRNTKEAA